MKLRCLQFVTEHGCDANAVKNYSLSSTKTYYHRDRHKLYMKCTCLAMEQLSDLHKHSQGRISQY